MLFKDERLKSAYDLENILTPNDLSMDSVTREIESIMNRIYELLSNGEKVLTNITDNQNDPIILSRTKITEDICFRSRIEIKQLLFRPDDQSQSTIARRLQKFGINPVSINDSEYGHYLQLLYFFYMMTYVVFPGENYFIYLTEKITSDNSPLESASLGKYWWFIIGNLLQNKSAADKYVRRDMCVSGLVEELTQILDDKISENCDYIVNRRRSTVFRNAIPKIIYEAKSEMVKNPSNSSLFDQLLIYAYQCQMQAYALDMIKNLGGDNRPFDFPEFQMSPNRSWKSMDLGIEEIPKFLRDREVVSFCKQTSIPESKRLDNEVRGNAFSFFKTIIDYDTKIEKQCGSRLFSKINANGEVKVNASILILMIRTYLDCNESLFMYSRKNEKWASKRKLQTEWSIQQRCPGTLASDLSMRLFIVAFQSQYLNATKGHGYYEPLFKTIYLSQYLLIQETMAQIFVYGSVRLWINALCDLIEFAKKI